MSLKSGEVYIKELIDKIRAGALVCTSNQRLKRHIILSYDSVMLLKGSKTWQTPQVVKLSDWLTDLLSGDVALNVAQPILTESRARVLFEEVVLSEADLSMEVPYKSALVRDSFNAYLLLKEHKVTLAGYHSYLTREASALKRFSDGYERLLEEKGFISPSRASSLASERIESGEIKIEGELILAGFEDITPALSSLVSTLKASGVSVSLWPDDIRGEGSEDGELERLIKGSKLYAYPDMCEEVVQAARFARERASEGKRTGIVVTKLSQYKELIEREFSQELAPASALLDNVGSINDKFNISMAAPISKSPIVKSALDLIAITRAGKPMETELVWEHFSSPYLGLTGEEYLSFAALDADLRRSNRSEISLSALSNKLSKEKWDSLKGFKGRLDSFIEAIKAGNGGRQQKRPSEWAGHFFAELKAFGWPGNVSELTSREFQAFKAFSELLADLAALDDIIALLDRGEAARRLHAMAEASTHQPKSPETLIEVIGLSESVGFGFDAVRIIGAYSDVLPPAIDPNPFIPISMQRELGFTRATPELEARRARERLIRLFKDAGEVVVSYPEMIDGKEVRVAPFFSSLKKEESMENRESNSLKCSVQASSRLEDMKADLPVSFLSKEMERLKGGTTIIKDQAACPFKAFATHRLGARIVESPEPGLSYMDRGTIVHSALKHFWEAVKDHKTLKSLVDGDKLIAQIRLSVDEALGPYNKRSFGEQHYLNLEKERLRRLLSDWLAIELSRSPFVVDSLEREDEREVSGLNIKFRIDRVDSVAGLGHAVIDYKTGKCSKNDWFGARPKEPQLLFYNLFGPYEALAFAQVKLGECKFEGIAKSEGILPGNKGFDNEGRLKNSLVAEGINNFEELGDNWRRVVEGLAGDFVDGSCVVDPNDLGSAIACDYSYCELKPFCRIFEAGDASGVEL